MRDQYSVYYQMIGLVCLCVVGCQQSPVDASQDNPQELSIAPEKATPQVNKEEAEAPTVSPGVMVCGESPKLVPGVPGSPGKLIESKINPNGQSELAHLMRKMLSEMKANQERAKKAEPLLALSIDDHGKIRCAWPTTESMRGGAYDPMARQYLTAIETFNKGPKTGQAHNTVVDACITCHKATCDGPTMAIEAVRFTAPPEGTGAE